MKKVISFVIVMLVMASLLLSNFQATLAAPPVKPTQDPQLEKNSPTLGKPDNDKHGKTQVFKGTVAEITATSLTITLKDGSSVPFVIDASTKIKIPTAKKTADEKINLGVQVVVQAKGESVGSLIARHIMVIPGKPTKFHRVGTVTDYKSSASITIKDKDGNLTTFLLTADTKILPKQRAESLAVDVKVTIISRRDPAGGPLMAQGIVIHPEPEKESGS